MYRVEIHVHCPIFQDKLTGKKLRPITLRVWALGIEKNCLKKGKKKYFFSFKKSQSVTHVSTCIFQGLFKNIVFRSVSVVTKKVMGYFRFFHRPDFFLQTPPACLGLKHSISLQ